MIKVQRDFISDIQKKQKINLLEEICKKEKI
jgi:hypothetical protein